MTAEANGREADAPGDKRPKRRRAKRIILYGLLLLAPVVAFFLYRSYQEAMDHAATASCANHFIQLYHAMRTLAQKDPDQILPATGDTREALRLILKDQLGENWPEGWLQWYASACPESFGRDGSIGYVYVGDGLRLGDVEAKRILILFCPGENHRGYSEHCHAWVNSEGHICVLTNAEMMEELKQAIARGESGDVPYSARAMKVLREELAKRLKPPE
ncbi:MAG TPA: hypothetical protein VM238_11985 [Phycisphaerae bacterium]|nr:hypothetical protein [Phycisphaerae bacterium]